MHRAHWSVFLWSRHSFALIWNSNYSQCCFSLNTARVLTSESADLCLILWGQALTELEEYALWECGCKLIKYWKTQGWGWRDLWVLGKGSDLGRGDPAWGCEVGFSSCGFSWPLTALDTFAYMCLLVHTRLVLVLSMALGFRVAFLYLSTLKSTLGLSEVGNQNRTHYFQWHWRNESPNDTLEFSRYIPTVRFSYWFSLGNPTLFYSWAILKIQSKNTYWLQGPLVVSNGAVKNGLNLLQMQGNMCCRRQHITLPTSNIPCLESSQCRHEVRMSRLGQVKARVAAGLQQTVNWTEWDALRLFLAQEEEKCFVCFPVFVFLGFITDSTEACSREALEVCGSGREVTISLLLS